MAGYRGKTGSLTQEQLQALGVVGSGKDNCATVQLAPPPLFPTISKPILLESNPDRDYKILWKEDFISFLKESAYYTKPKNSESKIQRYSDKYVNVLENDRKTKIKGEYLWDRMPSELKPNFKRTRDTKTDANANKKKEKVNVVEQLKVLEQKEMTDRGKTDNNKENKDSDDENENIDEVEDEEMDDENDYDNNYFDNGEAFNEEDDNMDDGPIY